MLENPTLEVVSLLKPDQILVSDLSGVMFSLQEGKNVMGGYLCC